MKRKSFFCLQEKGKKKGVVYYVCRRNPATLYALRHQMPHGLKWELHRNLVQPQHMAVKQLDTAGLLNKKD